MKPTERAASQSFLSSIIEVLDDSKRESLDQPLSLDELTKALESLEKNKTPRSVSLPAELYSALWDLIGQDLLKLYDSTLLADKRISESLVLLRDMITYMQDSGVDACLTSLHQEKAFGRISHTYMWDVLSKMGFGDRICNWIQLLYTNIVSTVSINWFMSICDPFKLASGAK
eukprot:g22560.t1